MGTRKAEAVDGKVGKDLQHQTTVGLSHKNKRDRHLLS